MWVVKESHSIFIGAQCDFIQLTVFSHHIDVAVEVWLLSYCGLNETFNDMILVECVDGRTEFGDVQNGRRIWGL